MTIAVVKIQLFCELMVCVVGFDLFANNPLYSNLLLPFSPENNRLRNNLRRKSDVSSNSIRSGPEDGCYTAVLNVGEFNEFKLTSRAKGWCDNCCTPRRSRDLHFVVYNKSNQKDGVEVAPHFKAGAARAAGVDSKLPTVIFIHGFSETSPGGSGRAIVDAYMARPEGYNVILLDWSELSAFPWYWEAFKNVKLVANSLTKFLETFNDSGEVPIANLHLIGFSLGAHVAGYVGKNLRKGLRLPRITGLDPAFPEFSLKFITKRLCDSDAEYVDVIHTDSGILGIPIPIGQSDFYPNGGRALQPGCQQSSLIDLNQIIACSHIRAWQFYAESVINPEAFPATKCRLWKGARKRCEFTEDAYMGFRANKTNARGSYYLKTKSKSPFSRSVEEQLL